MKKFVLIPARLDSTRIFQKMIKKFPDGSTVIGRTVDNCKNSNCEVHLISDSRKILDEVDLPFRQKHIVKNGNSGTERISYFLNNNDSFFDKNDLAIVVLGDQPEIDSKLINYAVEKFEEVKDEFDGVTFHIEKNDQKNFIETNNCKMILGKENRVFYISRSPIPGFKSKNDFLENECLHHQHVSIFALKVSWLKLYKDLEYYNSSRESNEWLPLILNNCKVKSYEIKNNSFKHERDVNTFEDWEYYEKRYV